MNSAGAAFAWDRMARSAQPSRPSNPAAGTGCVTSCQTYEYDALGRRTEIDRADTSSGGSASTGYINAHCSSSQTSGDLYYTARWQVAEDRAATSTASCCTTCTYCAATEAWSSCTYSSSSSYGRADQNVWSADGYVDDLVLRDRTTSGTVTQSGTPSTTDFDGRSDVARGVAVQADGKYVVAGSSSACGSSDFAIARYRADGTLDPSFSSDGKVRDNFGGSEGWAVATLETDGQILVGGYTTGAGGNRNFAVARYNANGSLDDGTINDADPTNSFGSAGIALIDFGGADGVRGLAVQPDGRIVAAGVGGSAGGMAVARLNADGTPDNSFDGDGKATVAAPGYAPAAAGVAIQPDGKVVVAGYACGASDGYHTVLARLNANGSPDSGTTGDADVSDRFGPAGGGGVAVVDFAGGPDRGQALALAIDGKIVLAGHTVSGGADYFAVARLTAEGTLDGTFGSGGKVTAFAAGSQAYAVAADGGGRLTVAGSVPRAGGTGGERDFVVARLLEDGAFDAGFGASGTVQTNFATNRDDAAYAIALTPAGGLVAVGQSNGDFALARYAPGGSATQRLYALQDANYNVTALVNAAGQVVQRFTYDAYGASQVLGAAWLGTSDGYDWLYRHQGGRLETATGTYSFRNRDYSPTLGRWMQEDPAGYVDGMSLYQSYRSSALTLVDPFGLACPTDPSPGFGSEPIKLPPGKPIAAPNIKPGTFNTNVPIDGSTSPIDMSKEGLLKAQQKILNRPPAPASPQAFPGPLKPPPPTKPPTPPMAYARAFTCFAAAAAAIHGTAHALDTEAMMYEEAQRDDVLQRKLIRIRQQTIEARKLHSE